MKPFRHLRHAGFSLIEMIGVLAIMAILATVIVPNGLKSLDRAAIRAEGTSLQALGEQVKLYLRANSVPPTTGGWNSELAAFADLSPVDLLTNKRNNARVFVRNDASRRAMIVSSMRSSLSLPTYAQINANFAAIWDTPDGAVPTTAGWASWAGTDNAGDYLVIQRINLSPVYATELLALTVTLNNNGGTTVSYRLTDAAGAVLTNNILAGATAMLSVRPRDRIDLHNAGGATGASLDYSYVISTSGKTFDFNGTQWLPQ